MRRTFPKFDYNAVTGEWNESLRGDYCWSGVNFREAMPDVTTPSTWSLMWIYLNETLPVHFPGEHPAGGPNHPFMADAGGVHQPPDRHPGADDDE